jgi:glycosyltransferase involved in cell wall biosynthesis
MKILEINKFYYRRRGGDKHFMDLIQLLESHGHEVAVLSMQHPKNEKSPWDKYFLSYVGYNKKDSSFWQKIKGATRMFYSWEARAKINQILDDFHPDVVHIHNIYHQMSPTILFEIKKRRIPVLMTVHDYKLVNPNHALFLNGQFYNRCKNGKYYQCFLDKCVKNSYAKSFLSMLDMYWHKWLGTYKKNIDLYVAPSLFARNILSDRGVDNGKIRILPHFISLNGSIKSEGANEMPENKEIYALYAGSISKEKGVDKLIEVFNEISGIKLYLAGMLENNFKIKESDKIKNLGFLDQKELQLYIENAKFIVSGSNLPETFGLVALEAIEHGKAFVGFKAGAFGEIIKDRENGFLVENVFDMKDKVNTITSGRIIFDSHKIREAACKAYDQERYYLEFAGLLKELTAKRFSGYNQISSDSLKT